MWLIAQTSSTALLVAMVLATYLLLRRSYRYFGRRNRDHEPIASVPRPKPYGSEVPHRLAKDVLHQEVCLHETARAASATLDNKIRVLQQLVIQAQKKIDRLEHLLQSGDETGRTRVEAVPDAPSSAEHSELKPSHSEIFALADRGFSTATIAHCVHTPVRTVEAILRRD